MTSSFHPAFSCHPGHWQHYQGYRGPMCKQACWNALFAISWSLSNGALSLVLLGCSTHSQRPRWASSNTANPSAASQSWEKSHTSSPANSSSSIASSYPTGYELLFLKWWLDLDQQTWPSIHHSSSQWKCLVLITALPPYRQQDVSWALEIIEYL